MTFSENLLALRKSKSLNQQEAAKAAGVVLRAYQRYEYGEREPQLSVLVKLARFYNISIDELVCFEKQTEPAAIEQTRDQPSL